MASGVGKSEEYAAYASQAAEIDKSMQTLLDELVSTLQRSSAAGKLEEKARGLAGEAARLAHDLDNPDEMEMNEKAVMLESLSERAERLLAAAPDAIVASEHERWTEELESIQSHLHDLRSSLNLLALPHVAGAARAGHEKRVRAHLTAAKLRLNRAHEGIYKRSHVAAHPLHANLTRIRKAMDGVRRHLGRQAERSQALKLEERAGKIGQEMRLFLQHQLNGRIYVDARTIQMRSDLTGQVQEWPADALHAQALAGLLSGTSLVTVLNSVRARKSSSLAAKFECKSDATGLMVDLEAGERSIVGDTIVYKPHVARISV